MQSASEEKKAAVACPIEELGRGGSLRLANALETLPASLAPVQGF